MKCPVEIVTNKTLETLRNNPIFQKQIELSILLMQKKISIEELFTQQNKLEAKLPKGIEIDWDTLKKEKLEVYLHERAHAKVNINYGFKPHVYKLSEQTYFVFCPDFVKIFKEKKYSLEDFIKIEKESLIAPHLGKTEITTADKLDILSYEIYCGNITEIKFHTILKSFKKYNWIYTEYTHP